MSVKSSTKSVKDASVQVTEAVNTESATVAGKPSAFDRLAETLLLIGKETAKPVDSPEQVKFGKAIGLLGGGSVYINRGNADVRSSQKQVAEWVAAGLGTARGPQSQYLRITF